MDATAQPSAGTAHPEAVESPTPTELRLAASRADLAASLRALASVANLTAANLERGGAIDEMVALFSVLQHCERQAGDRVEALGAMMSVCGTA